MSKYFRTSEFECKCGCGLKRIDPLFVASLSRLREDCGFPFVVNSGCRCETHNKKFTKAKNKSAHELLEDGFCHAADIKITTSRERGKFLEHVYKYFNRVGIDGSFIHVDNADRLDNGIHVPDVTWTY